MKSMIVTREMSATPRDLVGGKAANLFRLNRLGFAVPAFFCVSSDAFAAFIEPARGQLLTSMASVTPVNVVQSARAIAEQLSAAPLPEQLIAQVSAQIQRLRATGARFFSVRSSAIGEDSAEHSYAGLFHTFLYVPETDVLRRVRECWLSAYSANVLQYCLRNRLDPMATRIAVVVQEMIPSHCSGVLFTANPTGSLTEQVVVAGYGVGEGVVSNKVETDTYIYDTETGAVRSTINHKTYRMLLDPATSSGVCCVEVPSKLRDAAVLTDEMLQQVLHLGKLVATEYQHYQDVEWCMDEHGRLFVLQSRPITTIPSGKRTIFDNSNIVESFPGVTSPLSFSIVRRIYREVFSRMFVRLLLDRRLVHEHRERFAHLVGYVEGRIYYDIVNWYEMYKLLPLPGSFIVDAFNQLIGVHRGSDPRRFGNRRDRPKIGSAIWFACNCLARFVSLQPYLRRYERRFDAFYESASGVQWERLDAHELFNRYDHVFERYMDLASSALINDFMLMIFVGRTKALLKRAGADNPDELFNSLMCGEGVESALTAQELMGMAEMIRADRRLRSSLELVSEPAQLSTVLDDARFAEFANRFRAYMKQFGDRCPAELKLETVTFREDPLMLLRTILSYVPLDITVEKMQRNEQAVRRTAEASVRQHLNGRPVLRRLLNYCVGKTRRFIANRESARLDRGRAFGLMRSALRACGARLHRDGAIATPSDIFLVTIEELRAFVYGATLHGDLKDLVELNRKRIASFAHTTPSDRLLFSGVVGRNLVCQKRVIADEDSHDDVLRGISCCPGDLVAEAVVVTDPAAAPDVTGKIIVAQMTDPGWIFLMVASAGLIVEKGSVLSHTAIIGREFGIPTIVGVKDATLRIKSGSRVRMRASLGEVQLC